MCKSTHSGAIRGPDLDILRHVNNKSTENISVFYNDCVVQKDAEPKIVSLNEPAKGIRVSLPRPGYFKNNTPTRKRPLMYNSVGGTPTHKH